MDRLEGKGNNSGTVWRQV